MLDYDNLLWQMYHHDVQVFCDRDGWHLHICNKCINLQPDGKCGIYEKRPFACRDHSAEACEFDAPIAEWSKLFFENGAELDAFCRRKFRNWDKRFAS
jgi:Fe-S-cluster containining protein